MINSISRRQLLAGMSAAATLPFVHSVSASSAGGSLFPQGVASGDPDQSSLVIWTRVSPEQTNPRVVWELATDTRFEEVIDSGVQFTDPNRDYTLKVLIEGLRSGTTYYYRFSIGTEHSMLGRTMTLPSGQVDKLGIAVASCSNMPFGYFNAYDAIASDSEIDLVLHLGDYIYEYGQDGFGGETGKVLDRQHQPAHEIVSLADYRQRHAQYKSDPSSQRMHATHPLVVIWDDHESANNPWMGGAQNHQAATEGDWRSRRDASLQAYFEWMPIRDPDSGMSRSQYWRHFKFGNLASLISLETRHTGRTEQIDYLQHLDLLETPEGRDRFLKKVLGDPSRNMLSKPMESFLSEALSESVAANRPWRIIANQIPMARTHVPPLDHPAFTSLAANPADPLSEEMSYMLRMAELNLPLYLDTWDGYPAARERFYKTCANAGARDLLVLTGDSHSFWQNRLHSDSGASMGVEIGTTGISSPGDFMRFGKEGALQMDRRLAEHNADIVWTENHYNGYIRLVLNHQKARADFVAVSGVLSPVYESSTIKSENIVHLDGSLSYQN